MRVDHRRERVDENDLVAALEPLQQFVGGQYRQLHAAQ